MLGKGGEGDVGDERNGKEFTDEETKSSMHDYEVRLSISNLKFVKQTKFDNLERKRIISQRIVMEGSRRGCER